MLPAIALVGRPNVGKSTLFNQLTGSRDALVADFPGLTRDRRYGFGKHEGRQFLVIDTGGLGSDTDELSVLAAEQTRIALEEADAVVFVVDYKEGLTASDERVVEQLRMSSKPVTVAVNKSEGLNPEIAAAEFHSIGLGNPVSIAALHRRGISELLAQVLSPFEFSDEAEATRSGDGPLSRQRSEQGHRPDRRRGRYVQDAGGRAPGGRARRRAEGRRPLHRLRADR